MIQGCNLYRQNLLFLSRITNWSQYGAAAIDVCIICVAVQVIYVRGRQWTAAPCLLKIFMDWFSSYYKIDLTYLSKFMMVPGCEKSTCLFCIRTCSYLNVRVMLFKWCLFNVLDSLSHNEIKSCLFLCWNFACFVCLTLESESLSDIFLYTVVSSNVCVCTRFYRVCVLR